QFDGRARMTTWLTTIVINVGRMLLRRRRCQVSLDQKVENGEGTISDMLADPSPGPEQILERRELHALLAQLTRTLSPRQQAALRLSQQDGLTGKQVAQALGVPEGTVKARLARSRLKLSQRFHAITRTTKTRNSNDGSRARRASVSGYQAKCGHGMEPEAGI